MRVTYNGKHFVLIEGTMNTLDKHGWHYDPTTGKRFTRSVAVAMGYAKYLDEQAHKEIERRALPTVLPWVRKQTNKSKETDECSN